MLDRSDLLWRDDDPTPATTPARDDHAMDDQARQVTARSGAPGHTRATADEPAQERARQADEAREATPRAPQEPAGHDFTGFEQAPAGPREHPEWTPQQRANHEAHHARLARIREERAPEWARQDARDRQDEAARTHARDARAHDRRPTRADRARQERAGHRATPDPQTRTTGHRREHDTRAQDPEARHRARRSRTARTRDAVADVGLYRAVSYTDLSDQHFDGHPYATRRSVNHMIRAGLIEEHEATGPEGQSFKVLTATERGRDAAQRAAVDAGHVPEQQTWTGLVKPAELSHDTAVYRAALDERARIEAAGGRVTRVRLDAELKQIVATATEKARAEGGDRAAHEAKLAAAQALGLHVVNHDQVLYPDAQLDIEDADGRSGRVNVEIVSDHYHAAAIAAKAGAGFAMHGSSRSATRKIARALARESDRGGASGAAQPGRDGSVEL